MSLGSMLRRVTHIRLSIKYVPSSPTSANVKEKVRLISLSPFFNYSICSQNRTTNIQRKVLQRSMIRMLNSDSKTGEDEKQKMALSDEYVPFQDRKRIIQDVIDQQWNPQPEWVEEPIQTSSVNLERGRTGVFDLNELVDILKSEHAKDICVIALPEEHKYVDHMVIVTARSWKHMQALGTFIRKIFKSKKRKKTDIIPRVEGNKSSKDWMALDLGNIVLHVFCSEAREQFDLETLWTVGPQFDDLVNQEDSDIVRLLNIKIEPHYPKDPSNV